MLFDSPIDIRKYGPEIPSKTEYKQCGCARLKCELGCVHDMGTAYSLEDFSH